MTLLGLALDVRGLRLDTFMEVITITILNEVLFQDKPVKRLKLQNRVGEFCVGMDEVFVGLELIVVCNYGKKHILVFRILCNQNNTCHKRILIS